MKKLVLFVVLFMMMLCLALTGCAQESSSAAAGFGAPVPQWKQAESAPAEQALTNRPAETEQLRQTTGRPEAAETARTPNQPDETGKYRHEIDGIVFYTEHDLEQWIDRRDEPFYPQFNLEQMAKDLFTGKQIFGGDRIPEEWIDSFDGDTVIALKDPYHNNSAIVYTLDNADFDGHTWLQAKPGVYPYLANGRTYVYDLGKGTGDEEYYKPYYFLNGTYHCTDYAMLEIALYACEKWANGEYYDFENFDQSARIWVYRH